MKTLKIIGIVCGITTAYLPVCAASSECCVFCGDCSYTPPPTPAPTPTPSAPVDVCLFCGSGGSSSSSSSSTTTYANFSRAQTLSGQYFDDAGALAGTATLKVGKINTKKWTVKVTANLKSRSGKSYSASTTVAANVETGSAAGTLPFSTRNIGAMEFEIAYEEGVGMTFVGTSANGYTMQSYEAETPSGEDDEYGVLGSELAFTADCSELEPPEDFDFVVDFPSEVPVHVNSKGKWVCDAAASIKYKRFREDGETWYELTGLDDERRPNTSALSLSYNAKKGTFTGSFKIYASNESSIDSGKKPSLKAYKAKIKGQVYGSYGTGTATVKIGKITYTLPIEIVTVE